MMFDIGAFCRTCMCQILGDTKVTLKTYKILESLGLEEKLEQCCNIKVDPCDGYSPIVCEICYVKISDFYEFQQMCRHSLTKFAEIQQEFKSKITLDNAITKIPIVCLTEGRDIQLDLKSKDMLEDNPLLNLSDSVELWEEVEIERFCLATVEVSKENEQLSQAATCDQNESEADIEKIIAWQDKFEENCKTTNEDSTNMSGALCSYRDNSDCLTDGEVESLSEDCESLYDEENEKLETSNRLQCSLCSKRFKKKHCLESHMRTHEGLLEHLCPRDKCDRSYKRLCDLKQHLRDHDGIPREYYRCDKQGCDKEFKYKSSLKKHKDKVHNNDGPQKQPESHMCDTCGAMLRSAGSLRTHSLIHVDRSQWPFPCNMGKCSKRFATRDHLKVHQNRHAGIKNYPCPHCNMRFVTASVLKTHVNKHIGERTWSCELCPKVCNSPDQLRRHVESKHGVVNRYPSSICNQHFNSVNVGDDKQSAPAKEKQNRYPCDFCNRSFDSPSQKKLHVMIHTGEKPHACDECPKGFRTAAQLRGHKRSHMKELPRDHLCTVCNRAFFSSESLRHHKMKHTKEKPYKCEECGVSFRWPNNITRHRKLHLREKRLYENSREEESEEILIEVK